MRRIQDCAALIRYAFRYALVAYVPAWRKTVGLPYEPGFGEVAKFVHPAWPLGRELFRIWPGPFERVDLPRGEIAEFADTATLLHYNTFPVSRDLRAARPRFWQWAGLTPSYRAHFVGKREALGRPYRFHGAVRVKPGLVQMTRMRELHDQQFSHGDIRNQENSAKGKRSSRPPRSRQKSSFDHRSIAAANRVSRQLVGPNAW